MAVMLGLKGVEQHFSWPTFVLPIFSVACVIGLNWAIRPMATRWLWQWTPVQSSGQSVSDKEDSE